MHTISFNTAVTTLKLSERVSLDLTKINEQAWPGIVQGVARFTMSEASRSVIARITKEFADGKWIGYAHIPDNKASKDAGLTPTSNADALALRNKWKKENPSVYDEYMTQAENAAVQEFYNGTFRVREPGEPRADSKSPLEQRTFDIGRKEFDEKLVEMGIDVPQTKAGGMLPVGHKKLESVFAVAKGGEQVPYKDALPRYLAKHSARHVESAKRALEREAKERAKALESQASGMDF